jgi:malonyl CoA-acyl carrier protein transacylase
VKSRLINQIDNSVLFYDQILNIEKIDSPDYWYHIGPGNVTVGMVKKSISSKGLGVINSISSLNEI